MQSAGIDAVSQPQSASALSNAGTMRRLVGLLVAIASGALLTLSALLTPSEAGLGTHEQIFPAMPCSWIEMVGCPCPTCGMTTAFAHAADGNLVGSFLAQPMGALLAIATAMTFLLSTFVALTGSRVAHRLTRLWHPRMVWMIAILVIGSWFYKIASYKGWL